MPRIREIISSHQLLYEEYEGLIFIIDDSRRVVIGNENQKYNYFVH